MNTKILFAVALAAASVCSVEAETLTLGYAVDKMATNSPVGISFGDNEWIEEAIYIPASTLRTLKGCKIKSVRGYLPSIADIETVRGWVKNDLDGETLVEFTLVPNQLNNVKRGYNKLTFKTPLEITDENLAEGMYIGFGLKIKSGNARGLSAIETPIPGAFFLRKADGQWYDCSSMGATCVDFEVEGDNLPEHNLKLSNAASPDVYVMRKGSMPVTLYLNNFGTKPIKGFDIVAEAEGKISEKVHVDKVIAPSQLESVSLTLKPEIAAAGKGEITYRIMGLDEGTDADIADNQMSFTIEAVTRDFTRYMLSEEFTTEQCGNCPEVIALVHELLQRPEYANVIQVAHHAGYKTDFLTQPWHTTFTGLFGGGTFAPALCADRAERKPGTILYFPEDINDIAASWDKQLAVPALVSVNISAVYTDESETAIKVKVSGEKTISELCPNPVINVMLTESGIPQQEQANGSKDFVHDHVSRAVSAENHWGDPLSFSGDQYEYECTLKLDPEWKKENMKIVAYVGDNSAWNKRQIANAAQADFADIYSSGIDGINSDTEVVAVEYFDMSGRKVSDSSCGVLIKRTTYSDGSVRTTKELRVCLNLNRI